MPDSSTSQPAVFERLGLRRIVNVSGTETTKGASPVCPEVIAAVALLPVLAIAATWLFSRPIPEWQAFRGPTS